MSAQTIEDGQSVPAVIIQTGSMLTKHSLRAVAQALGIPAATLAGLRDGSLAAVPRSLLEAAAEFLATGSFAEGTCMCGSPMEAHDIGSGHSPVDAGNYHARSVHEQIAAMLAAAQEPGHE